MARANNSSANESTESCAAPGLVQDAVTKSVGCRVQRKRATARKSGIIARVAARETKKVPKWSKWSDESNPLERNPKKHCV